MALRIPTADTAKMPAEMSLHITTSTAPTCLHENMLCFWPFHGSRLLFSSYRRQELSIMPRVLILLVFVTHTALTEEVR